MAAILTALVVALLALGALGAAAVAARRAATSGADTLTALRLAQRGALVMVRTDADHAREQARRAR